MKKICILLISLIFLNGCSEYPENETFVCKNRVTLEGDYVVNIDTTYYAEYDYIHKVERHIYVDVDKSVEEKISLNFKGDRESFSEFITKEYSRYTGTDYETLKLTDEGDTFINRHVSYRPEIVRSWRTLVLPKSESLEDFKHVLSSRNLCNP